MQVLAEGFRARVAKNALGGRVPIGDSAFRVHHQDGILGRVGDGAQAGFIFPQRRFRLLARGDVAHHTRHHRASAAAGWQCRHMHFKPRRTRRQIQPIGGHGRVASLQCLPHCLVDAAECGLRQADFVQAFALKLFRLDEEHLVSRLMKLLKPQVLVQDKDQIVHARNERFQPMLTIA